MKISVDWNGVILREGDLVKSVEYKDAGKILYIPPINSDAERGRLLVVWESNTEPFEAYVHSQDVEKVHV
jgi:hypothetical protein